MGHVGDRGWGGGHLTVVLLLCGQEPGLSRHRGASREGPGSGGSPALPRVDEETG